MAFLDLRAWIHYLEERDQLHRVTDAVDIRYDIPHLLEADDGHKSTLFEKVNDYTPTPVLGGSFGSRRQLAEVLGIPVSSLLSHYIYALEHPIAPVEIEQSKAPVLEIQENEVHLDHLPAPWHHEKDNGKYITAAIAIAKAPATGIQNWSIHRLQINDERHLGIFLIPRHLWSIFAEVEAQGKDLPIALVLGLSPGYLLASQAVTAFGVDEAEIGGGLFRQPLPMVRSPRYGILVPAYAEYLFEGRLLAQRREPEGPFGEFPRTYGPQSDKHVLEVDEIFHRANPIFQTILPASREHLLLGAVPREAAIYNCVRNISPNIRDVVLTFAGGCRFHVVISMKPQRKGEAKNVMIAAFAGSSDIKCVIVVDEDIDISRPGEVEWAIATRVQPHRDITIIEDALGSALDPSADERGLSSKWGIDATIPIGASREHYESIQTPRRRSNDHA